MDGWLGRVWATLFFIGLAAFYNAGLLFTDFPLSLFTFANDCIPCLFVSLFDHPLSSTSSFPRHPIRPLEPGSRKHGRVSGQVYRSVRSTPLLSYFFILLSFTNISPIITPFPLHSIIPSGPFPPNQLLSTNNTLAQTHFEGVAGWLLRDRDAVGRACRRRVLAAVGRRYSDTLGRKDARALGHARDGGRRSDSHLHVVLAGNLQLLLDAG